MKLVTSIVLLLILSGCSDSMKTAYDNGYLFKSWSFDHIEPYKEGSSSPEFIQRIQVTPIELDFTKGEEGKFKAFYPNFDSYASDYLISHDISGSVEFKVREKVILAKFDDLESDYDLKMRQIRIIELTDDKLVFEASDPKRGHLYHIHLK